MKRLQCIRSVTIFCLGLLLFLGTRSAFAVDGVIEINQHRALAGGVTSGDTPGFPVTLDTEGSYRLTGNLRVDKDTTAILVKADAVTVDLNGFSILGDFKVGGQGVGILQDSNSGFTEGRLTVRNGTISGVGSHGILGGNSVHVENVQVLGCGGTGIKTIGVSVIRNNSVAFCQLWGIETVGSVVQNNAVSGNGGQGSSRDPDQPGGGGIHATNVSVVLGNSATSNIGPDILMSADTGYEDNVVGGKAGIVGGKKLGHNLCGGSYC